MSVVVTSSSWLRFNQPSSSSHATFVKRNRLLARACSHMASKPGPAQIIYTFTYHRMVMGNFKDLLLVHSVQHSVTLKPMNGELM